MKSGRCTCMRQLARFLNSPGAQRATQQAVRALRRAQALDAPAPPTTWHAAKLMARHTRRLRGAARLGAAPRQAQQRGELLDGGRVRIGAPAAVQRELQHVHAVRRLRPDPQGQGTHPDP